MKLDLAKHIDKQKGITYFKKLLDKQAKVELKEIRNRRSVDQNAYLHVCISLYCEHTGYTIAEAKEVLSKEYGSFMVYEKNKNQFRRSTSDLDSLECTKFIEFIRDTGSTLGIYIPTPEEYLEHQFDLIRQTQHIH